MDQLDRYIDTWEWKTGVTPLSHWTAPVFGSIGYLILVSLVVFVMRYRKPFDLKTVSIVHNVFLTVLSAVMMLAIIHAAFLRASKDGLHSLFCERTLNDVSGRIGFWTYIFHLSKYYEYADTIIMALRKKPIIFLHFFHHALVVPVTWKWLDDQWMAGSWWCVLVNSMVHAFMYYYYLLTSLGRPVPWKEYITLGQLVQFFSGFVVVSYWFVIRNEHQCQGGLPAALLSHASNTILMFLFFKFYFATYKRSRNVKSAKKEE